MRYQFRMAFVAVVALLLARAPGVYGAVSYTLWPSTSVPTLVDSGPDAAVELGIRFRADTNGTVTGIRFYKAPQNTGTHVGNLWDSNGTRLATATFSGETASGWQQVNFPTPISVTANTIYVASYHTAVGHYSDDINYFSVKGRDNPPLHAPADGASSINGVYSYGTASSYPNQGWFSSNYWVDVAFTPATADTTAPVVSSFTVPSTSNSLSVYINGFTATDNVAVTGYLVSESASAPAPTATGWAATPPSSYTFASAGTKTLFAWAKDAAGNVSTSRSSTVTVTVSSGSDRPILLITSSSNPFSSYYAEILRAEGMNSFVTADIGSVSASTLSSYDLAILGEMTLTSAQVTMFTTWVTGGGHLVAMRPDKKLASLLGVTALGSTLSNGYLLVNTSSGAGKGIVNQTIQFHGTADLYTLSGATSLATLYSDATRGTSNPAVAQKAVGTQGGVAAAFFYDLARSVVYTRQGNPAWSGQERDGSPPIRSDDLFFGAAAFDRQADWVNLAKVAIPQADEQQRLLANMVIQMNFDKKPLPRFAYLPRNLPAAVVMTGDDHANGGTAGRFERFLALSPPNCSVENWECIRGTSYLVPSAPLSNAQAARYVAQGFEVALHVDTNCLDWTPSSLDGVYGDELSTWSGRYPDVPLPVTERTHCIVWSDYVSQPKVELSHGMRLDTNYYFWPPAWVRDTPGFFTGSGIPMRFADPQGRIIDVYQAPTQMTDESGQSYPFTINTLLDRATGAEGYYGVFVVNAHTDSIDSPVADAVVYSALARGVPVITSRQLLTWLDGRNSSSFGSISWNGTAVSFAISTAPGATGLTAMVPVADGKTVSSVTRSGVGVPFTVTRMKGIQYALFAASGGNYQVSFSSSTAPPSVAEVAPYSGQVGVGTSAAVTARFSASMDASSLNTATFLLKNGSNVSVAASVAYDAATRTATLTPTARLANSTSYTATVKGGANGVKDVAGNALSGDYVWSFSTAAQGSGPFSIWPAGTIPGMIDSGPDSAVELGVKFRSDSAGSVTGIRFYKAAANTGTHVANLWSSAGKLLATATFANESASGWQQVNFPSAVPITANTVYVASYHTATGHYSFDGFYFASKGVDNAPLHAPANGVSGFNGVYAYGSGSSFPNKGWNSSNYWVDVVFSPDSSPLQTLQSLGVVSVESISVAPESQTVVLGSTQQFTATATYSDGSSRDVTNEVAWNSSNLNLVTVSSRGLVSAVGVGQATVTATLNGITGNTTMNVRAGVAGAVGGRLTKVGRE